MLQRSDDGGNVRELLQYHAAQYRALGRSRVAVHSRRHHRVRGIVPHDGIALVSDKNGYADGLARRCVIEVFAIDGAAAIVQDAFLVLSNLS